jgi:hypothetical protein
MERDERLLPSRPHTAEIMMWACVIGVFCVAAVVNQGAIALFRRAQAVTESNPRQRSSPERDLHQQWPDELQSCRR